MAPHWRHEDEETLSDAIMLWLVIVGIGVVVVGLAAGWVAPG